MNSSKTSRCSLKLPTSFWPLLATPPLVMHNAAFDIGFLNSELERLGRPAIGRERIIDTLLLARRKHAGASNRLDDLCERYAIDSSRRTLHGALLDAELLAEVYVELIGARQAQLVLSQAAATALASGDAIIVRERPLPPVLLLSADESRGAPPLRGDTGRRPDLAGLSQLGLSGCVGAGAAAAMRWR